MNETIRNIIAERNFVILDTETTGLRRPAEIIELAVIDPSGQALLNTRLKPKAGIPAEASRIHGITIDMLQDCPTWPDVRASLFKFIDGKNVLVYNAKYDRHMMHCSDELWELPQTDYHAIAHWHCIMEAYADFWGEFDLYHGSNKWQKLTTALAQQGLAIEDAHSAIGDCRATLALLRKVTGDLDAWKLISLAAQKR
jgi:DNA polymerase-3 subunit epsilon